MTINVFPVQVASSSSGPSANAITCASANTLYGASISLNPGIYTVTCVNTTVVKVDFMSDDHTVIMTAVTVSGTVTINLGTAATYVRMWTDTGTNVVVTITLTAGALTNNFSGTLDTISSSSTYTGTSTSGYAYVIVGGGGGGGANGLGQTYGGGAGGGAGGVGEGIVRLNGSMPAVIGALGVNGAPGAAGGTTNFAGITANGGEGGTQYYSNGVGGGNATGGLINTPGYGGGPSMQRGTSYGGDGGSPRHTYTFITTSLGTAGYSEGGNGPANSATGKVAGGGGGGSYRGGGSGAPGVVYVLKY